MALKGMIYLNGDYMARRTATVSIYDRGFRFGDGVFETIRLGGKNGNIPFLWEAHLQRLESGLESLRIPLDLKHYTSPSYDESWPKVISELAMKNQHEHGLVRIYVTRGTDWQPRGYLASAEIGSPTILIETMPSAVTRITDSTKADSNTGLSLWLSSVAKPAANSAPVACKVAANGIHAMLARMEAEEHHCNEALMLDAQQHISEASSSNLFWFDASGTLCTPTLSCDCLPGVTREAILKLVGKYQLCKTRQVEENIDILHHAQGAFLTNAALGIQLISHIRTDKHNQPNIDINFTTKTLPILQKIQHRLEEERQRCTL